MEPELIRLAIQATAAVAPVLREYHAQKMEVFSKADNSPVTAADRAAHEIISSYLLKSGFPVVSEEGDMKTGPIVFPAFWLIDPLDGTKEFIKKRNEFTVNIAFIKNGIAVCGVIGIPMEKSIWVGAANHGLHVLTEDDVANRKFEKKAEAEQNEFRTIVTSLSHPHPKITHFIDQERVLFPDLRVVAAGSSLKFCLTAIGTNTIYPRFSPCMIWDVAAGDAILRSVGKSIVQLQNQQHIIYTNENWVVPPFIAQ